MLVEKTSLFPAPVIKFKYAQAHFGRTMGIGIFLTRP